MFKKIFLYVVGFVALMMASNIYAAQGSFADAKQSDISAKKADALGNSFASTTVYPAGTRFTITEVHSLSTWYSSFSSKFYGKNATAADCLDGFAHGIELETGSRAGYYSGCFYLDGDSFEYYVYGFKFSLITPTPTPSSCESKWTPISGTLTFSDTSCAGNLTTGGQGGAYSYGQAQFKQTVSVNNQIDAKMFRLSWDDARPMEVYFIGGSFGFSDESGSASFFFWESDSNWSGWIRSSAIIPLDWNSVTIKQSGSNVEAFVNGQSVGSFQLKNLSQTSGKVSIFFKGDPDSVSKMAFADFKVSDTQTTPTPAALTGLSETCPSTINAGASAACSATASYSDGSSKSISPTWTSSNATTLSVGSGGGLTAGAPVTDTSVTVSASYTEGGVTKTATAMVTVKAAATITPPVVSTPVPTTCSGSSAFFNPANSMICLPTVDVPLVFGGSLFYQVELNLIPGSNPLKLTLKNAVQVSASGSASASYNPATNILTIPALQVFDAFGGTQNFQVDLSVVPGTGGGMDLTLKSASPNGSVTPTPTCVSPLVLQNGQCVTPTTTPTPTLTCDPAVSKC